MANVAFKKGLLANLPAAKVAGTFYVTTDERAIYLDVDDSTRIRIGDFQEFATVADLEANPNPSTTALYYVSGINCLAKWNGTGYVQINRDTGATDFEVVGEGNAVTSVSYDSANRKLTLTKGVTFATSGELTSLTEKVNALEVVGGQANVIETVKVNGTALSVSEKAVDVKIEESAVNGNIKVNGVDVAIHGLGSAAYTDASAYDAAGTAETKANAVQSDLDTYKASNNTAVAAAAAKGQQGIDDAAAAKERADAAYELAEEKATVNEVLEEVAKDYATKTELASTKSTIENAFAAADTALKNELTPLINAKVDQSVYDAKVSELEGDIAELVEEDARLEGLIGENTNAIAVEKGRIDAQNERLTEVEAFFKLAEGESLDTALDTLVEIQKYITEEGAAADQMVKDIAANAQAIADEAAAREAADSTLQASINAVNEEVGKKASQEDHNALANRVTAAEGNITTLQGALEDAEDAIEGLNTSKADASDVEELSTEFTNYKAAHANDYTNAQIDAAIDADVKVVADDLDAYKTAHADDYTNAQIDAAIDADVKVVSDALDTAVAGLSSQISQEANDRAAAITSAINALDSEIAADDGYALTKVVITDGKLTGKEQAKFATESYVDNQIAAAALSWGSF